MTTTIVDLSAYRRPPKQPPSTDRDLRPCFSFVGVAGVGLVIGPGPTVKPVFKDRPA